MNIFVDTSIWVYATDDSSPFYPDAVRKLSGLQADGYRMIISTQTLREYAKACTSARVLAHQDIVNNMDWMRRQFSVLDETALVIAELEKLLVSLVPPAGVRLQRRSHHAALWHRHHTDPQCEGLHPALRCVDHRCSNAHGCTLKPLRHPDRKWSKLTSMPSMNRTELSDEELDRRMRITLAQLEADL